MATAKKAAKKSVAKAVRNAKKAVVPKKVVSKKVVAKKVVGKKAVARKTSKPGVIESLIDTVRKKAKKLVATSKRTLVEPTPGDKRYVRRDSSGKFKDVVDVGKSLSADKRTTAKTKVKAGQGDKGDIGK